MTPTHVMQLKVGLRIWTSVNSEWMRIASRDWADSVPSHTNEYNEIPAVGKHVWSVFENPKFRNETDDILTGKCEIH